MVAHDDDRVGGRRRGRVEPVDLVVTEVAARLVRHARVQQGDVDPGQLDPRVAGVVLLTPEAVVVVAHARSRGPKAVR